MIDANKVRKTLVKTIEEYSDQQLKSISDVLGKYNPTRQFAPGVTMEEWAKLIKIEMKKRGLLTNNKK
jgi:hypothetical protein